MNFRKRNTLELPVFQIAPMIDIVFLLSMFFIASQIFAQWETEIDITLPTATTATLPDRLPGEIILNLRQTGEVVVNQQVMNEAAVSGLLRRIVALFPGQPVLLRADRLTPYEHVIKVLDLCRRADVWNISFATSYPNE